MQIQLLQHLYIGRTAIANLRFFGPITATQHHNDDLESSRFINCNNDTKPSVFCKEYNKMHLTSATNGQNAAFATTEIPPLAVTGIKNSPIVGKDACTNT